MDLLIANVAVRPDLAPLLDGFQVWPRFMRQDPIGWLYYADATTAHPEFVLAAVDRGEPDRLVAKGYSVPFAWDDDPTEALPEDGWDGVIIEAAVTRAAGRQANLVSALEISIRPDLRGRGLARVMLAAMLHNAAALGFRHLVAPVRPSGKHHQPDTPIRDYARLRRADGLPVDPWVRVHVRAGGRVIGTTARSMTMAGTLEQWRDWTGLPFEATGPVMVPEALVPVMCDVAHDVAVYVEPGIWLVHDLTGRGVSR